MKMADMQKSVYKRGADDGFYFGIYLIVLFFATVFTMTIPFAGLLSLVLMLGVPFYVYRFLRRAYVKCDGNMQFSELWLHGIVIFFCGGLIAGIVAFVYMRWIEPDFLVSQARAAITVWEKTDMPQAREMSETLTRAIEQKMLPSAIQMVIEMLWLQVFTGSMLSIVLSLAVRSVKIKNTDKTKQI